MENSDKNQKRLVYLAQKFEIFTSKEGQNIINEYSHNKEVNVYPIKGHNNTLLALKWSYLPNKERKRVITKVTISDTVFTTMLVADPSNNKIFIQWMLNTFMRIIKEDDNIKEAVRFVDEDLNIANSHLSLFEANKRKKRFGEWAIKNELRKWKMDNKDSDISEWEKLKYEPSDINQYKSLSQLFDAVDPFIERKASDLERAMQHFININEADIPFRDRKWTVFVPLTTEANVIFDKFASWCTAKPGNSMFDRYTKNDKLPNGENSTMYVIINNKMFTGESKECYQIHFESKQIKDQSNDWGNINLYELVLSTSDGIREYFHSELDNRARMSKGDVSNNKYIDYLISFGYTESLFDYLDKNLPIIKITGREVPRLPDISKFKTIDQLLLMKLGMHELHPSIGLLTNLELLSLSDNKISKLPKEIGNLKKLDFFNLKGNPITDFPDEISQLDRSNGGSLFRLSVDKKDIGEVNYQKLKLLLPNATIGE